MKTKKMWIVIAVFLILILCVLFTVLSCKKPNKDDSAKILQYTNPIINKYLADPCIIKSGDTYYLFATGGAEDGRRIPIHRSIDLVNWEFVRGAVERGAEGAWNRRNFWAPDVIKINGQYCLYYTASVDGTPQNTGNRVGLAVSDKPEGPYDDRGVVIPNASLDGYPFRDTDGTYYLYYTIEHGNSEGLTAGHIYVDKLVEIDRVANKPVKLISHHRWQEGTCMLYNDGTYYLTYSTGSWSKDTYKVQWAVGTSAAGPFEEQPGLILQSTDQVKGPGHHNFFTGRDGNVWIVYHGWDPGFKKRYPRIDPLIINSNGLSSNGPTSTLQKIVFE